MLNLKQRHGTDQTMVSISEPGLHFQFVYVYGLYSSESSLDYPISLILLGKFPQAETIYSL